MRADPGKSTPLRHTANPLTDPAMPNNTDLLLTQANKLLHEEKIKEAKSVYQGLLDGELSPAARVNALDGMARCHTEENDFAEAEKLFTEALEIMRGEFGESHPNTAILLQNLARMHSRGGDVKKAQELGNRAVWLIMRSGANLTDEAAKKKNALHLAQSLFALSDHYYRDNELDAAEYNIKEAMKLWVEHQGRETFEVSTCLNNLGRIYEQKGSPEKSVPLHQEAVFIRKNLLGDHPATAFSLGNLGSALAESGRWKDAETALDEAVECYRRLGLAHTPEAAACARNLQTARQINGRG